MFKLFESWGWDRLPEQYKCQPHICSDTAGSSKSAMDMIHVPSPIEPDTITDELSYVDQMDLPSKKVGWINITTFKVIK